MNTRSSAMIMSLWLAAGVALTTSIASAQEAKEGTAYEVKLPTTPAKSVEPTEKLAKAGKIVMCTELGNPPGGFLAEDGVTPKGFNVDVMSAIGPVMGIKSEVVHYPFASIFAALDTGKCDAVMSNNSKSPARIAKYNFVEYIRERMGLLVPKGNPLNIKTYEDLAGHRVAVLVSSTNERLLKEASAKVEAEGKPAIEIQSYPQNTTTFRQLDLKRVDAFVSDAMTLSYFMKLTDDKYEIGGLPIDPLTIGIVLRKDDPALHEAVRKAYVALFEGGYVEQAAKTWGMDGHVELCRDDKQCP
ncbi:ABC transporter substrate-binding protein [Agrobacterium vitis]|uniref:ABC transporter substrate-binding protein n=2 Tax=Agrobacterium TaxID=357 RepID=A0AAE2R751_AGRVI|nr:MULTISPECIES: ABC transporter substrate-binding protein [Rhizobium/Agrobacterium group]MCF1501858.1 ABC transporter substrate-binding protein [Allorhizobium sp. Av2]MBF2712673.1 ABC transporter substrate-binding protein [Agrobacterium vitis]MCF1480392.1 ABC transporter substrate-binding protein [Agrobacterium vitis]MCF1495058.1 ABC transporter substrate-binding protein [Allorhizobium ampelinum]MCM2443272.1 ABC transporter substrate-binding protein [Agrobacterium vitis]